MSLKKSVFKSILGRYALYAATAITTVVFSRVFSPEVFGVVASVTVFNVFFQLMSEAGIGPALINLKNISDEDRDGIFSLTLIIGLVTSIGFFLAGPAIQKFYDINDINKVVPFVSVSVLFYSASVVPNAFLLRSQFFYRIAQAGVLAELFSMGLTLVLNKFLDPVFCLGSKMMFTSIFNFSMLFYYCRLTEFGRPSLGSKVSAVIPMLHFSVFQFGFNFVNFFARNFDNLLVGRYFGANLLGVYDKAYVLMKYPLMILTHAMTPAIQPALREYSDEVDKIENIHRSFTLKLSVAGSFAGLFVFLAADQIVLLILGHQWQKVIPFIRILSISIPLQIVGSSVGSFFQTLNKTNLMFISGLLSAVFMVVCMFGGVVIGSVETLCWALVIAYHINFIQCYSIVYLKIFRKNFKKFLLNCAPMFLLSLIEVYMVIVLNFKGFDFFSP